MNALTHGLTSKVPFLPSESEEEYDAFRVAQLKDLAPDGALQEQLAGEIVDLNWRLLRATKLEHGVLANGIGAVDERWFSTFKASLEITNADYLRAKAMPNGGLDDVANIVNPDLYEFVTDCISDAQSMTRYDESRLAGAFMADAAGANAMSKLGRHEMNLFRRRNQALATYWELQETNRARKEEK
jgi:hypothetical protein